VKLVSALIACGALLAATPAPSVTVDGAFARTQRFDAAGLAALPSATLTVDEEHGDSHVRYDGVTLATLLNSTGVPTGKAVKGAPARSYVVVRAADGYAALFSLAELDSTDGACAPILADRRNGAALPPNLGAFRVIAPCDRTQARWVWQVTELSVVTVLDNKQDKLM
jgi:hypothetical protein